MSSILELETKEMEITSTFISKNGFKALTKFDFFKVAQLFQNPEIHYPKTTVYIDKLVNKKRVLLTACQYYDLFSNSFHDFQFQSQSQELKTDLATGQAGQADQADLEKREDKERKVTDFLNLIWCYSYYLAAKLYASINIADLVINAMLLYTDDELFCSVFSDDRSERKKMIGYYLEKMVELEKDCIPILAKFISVHGRSNFWEMINDTKYRHQKNKIWPCLLFLSLNTNIAIASESLIDKALDLRKRFESCKSFFSKYSTSPLSLKGDVEIVPLEIFEKDLKFKNFWHQWNKLEMFYRDCLRRGEEEREDDGEFWFLLLDKTRRMEWKNVLSWNTSLHKCELSFISIVDSMILYCQRLYGFLP
jgi:hypothetical protein